MNLEEAMKLEKWKNFVKIKIIPNSQKNEFVEKIQDGTLKVKIKWIPENWKVNRELIIFLCKKLELSNNAIFIISGAKARNKLLRIDF